MPIPFRGLVCFCSEQTAPAGAADVCEVAIHQQKAAQENSKVELAASGMRNVACILHILGANTCRNFL